MILRKIRIHDAAAAAVHHGFLVQRERHAPDHAAEQLAADQVRIDDAPGGEGADHAGDADLAEIGIDLDLGKHRAMRVHRVVRLRRGVGGARAAARRSRQGRRGRGYRHSSRCALHRRDGTAGRRARSTPALPAPNSGERSSLVASSRKLGDHGGAGVVDRHARGRGMGRAAGNAGIRQVRGAGPELDSVEVEPQSIGGDLGERGPGALPHVVGADLHHAGAVALASPRAPRPGTSAPETSPCRCPSRPGSRPRRASCRGASGRFDQPKRSAPCA